LETAVQGNILVKGVGYWEDEKKKKFQAGQQEA